MSSMNYDLNRGYQSSTRDTFRKILVFMEGEKRNLAFALLVMLLNSGVSLVIPLMMGYAIDHYIVPKLLKELLIFCGFMFIIYAASVTGEYFQTLLMGNIGQRMLYRIRNAVFDKIQLLPIAFFNQNKSGDLISRINNDTQTVNQFFSQSLMRFIDSIFMITVSAGFLLFIHPSLGGASLVPAVFILLFVRFVNPWVRKKNAISSKMDGLLSGQVQESLAHFKTIIAFDRRDFFRKKFDEANQSNYKSSVISGIANGLYAPVFSLFSDTAQLIVLAYGIYLIGTGQLTIGLLISYLAYVRSFYRPLRQIAGLWASFQSTIASWDRIAVILDLETDLNFGERELPASNPAAPLLTFRNVSFEYNTGMRVLENINMELHKGKTYALVGPTGGGKTTTASLIARLYDPDEGEIQLDGIPLKDYPKKDLSEKIGFILQEPFLFSGTLRENILYGYNGDHNKLDLNELLLNNNFTGLISTFPRGLETKVSEDDESLSLGQKQIIAFMRAVLRHPELLIMDEATANIDTVTEKQLEKILYQLPKETTLVIIAHRLNTIANADRIFFISAGQITDAGSLDNAVKLLLKNKRET